MHWPALASTSRAPARRAEGRAGRPSALRAGPALRASAGAAGLAVAALAAGVLAASPALRWPVVARFLFNPAVLAGVATTVELTVLSQVLACAAGLAVALLGRSSSPAAAWLARLYIWVFRAVPLIVQLLFWFNIALVVPVLRLDAPLIGFQVPVNEVITGFGAALLGLGLHESAFMAEIIRAGLLSVPADQVDAAMDLGLSRGQAMRLVVLPQALRVIIPAAGNQVVGLLKASALVSVIGGGDLLTRTEYLYGENFQVIPLLAVATLWYLALVGVFSALQHLIEARLGGPAAAP